MRRRGSRLNLRILALTLVTLIVAGCASSPNGGTDATTTTSTTTTPPTTTTQAQTQTPFSDGFDTSLVGGAPAGWTVASGTWTVELNLSAPSAPNVVRQSNKTEGEPTLLADKAGEWSDLDATVKVNILGGEQGQAGGLTFRYKDAKNYYVVRYNHAEGQWNLFRTIDGKRQKYDAVENNGFNGSLDQWFDVHLVAKGAHITVTSGNRTVIDYNETEAGAPTTGKVGIWVRYDSQTLFDDFSVRPA